MNNKWLGTARSRLSFSNLSLGRKLQLSAIVVVVAIAGIICVAVLNGVKPERVEAIAHSPYLFIFRITIYALIWIRWSSLVQSLSNKPVNNSAISVSRRPLLVLIIAYELLLPTDLVGKLNSLW